MMKELRLADLQDDHSGAICYASSTAMYCLGFVITESMAIVRSPIVKVQAQYSQIANVILCKSFCPGLQRIPNKHN